MRIGLLTWFLNLNTSPNLWASKSKVEDPLVRLVLCSVVDPSNAKVNSGKCSQKPGMLKGKGCLVHLVILHSISSVEPSLYLNTICICIRLIWKLLKSYGH